MLRLLNGMFSGCQHKADINVHNEDVIFIGRDGIEYPAGSGPHALSDRTRDDRENEQPSDFFGHDKAGGSPRRYMNSHGKAPLQEATLQQHDAAFEAVGELLPRRGPGSCSSIPESMVLEAVPVGNHRAGPQRAESMVTSCSSMPESMVFERNGPPRAESMVSMLSQETGPHRAESMVMSCNSSMPGSMVFERPEPARAESMLSQRPGSQRAESMVVDDAPLLRRLLGSSMSASPAPSIASERPAVRAPPQPTHPERTAQMAERTAQMAREGHHVDAHSSTTIQRPGIQAPARPGRPEPIMEVPFENDEYRSMLDEHPFARAPLQGANPDSSFGTSHEAAISQLRAELAKRDEQSAQLSNQLAELRNTMQIRAEMAKHDEQALQLSNQMGELRNTMQLQAEMAKHDEQAVQLSNQMAELRNTMQLQAEMAKRDEQMAELRNTVQLRAEIAKRDEQAALLSNQLAELTKAMQSLQVSSAALDHSREVPRAQHDHAARSGISIYGSAAPSHSGSLMASRACDDAVNHADQSAGMPASRGLWANTHTAHGHLEPVQEASAEHTRREGRHFMQGVANSQPQSFREQEPSWHSQPQSFSEQSELVSRDAADRSRLEMVRERVMEVFKMQMMGSGAAPTARQPEPVSVPGTTLSHETASLNQHRASNPMDSNRMASNLAAESAIFESVDGARNLMAETGMHASASSTSIRGPETGMHTSTENAATDIAVAKRSLPTPSAWSAAYHQASSSASAAAPSNNASAPTRASASGAGGARKRERSNQAARRSRQAGLDGVWSDGDMTVIIKDGTIGFSTGEVHKLEIVSDSECIMRLNGNPHFGRLDPSHGGRLIWSDGDVWIRRLREEHGLDGEWSSDSLVVAIKGSKIAFSTGEVSDLERTSETTCTLRMNGKMHYGQLDTGRSKLLWSDGDVWVRRLADTGHEVPPAMAPARGPVSAIAQTVAPPTPPQHHRRSAADASGEMTATAGHTASAAGQSATAARSNSWFADFAGSLFAPATGSGSNFATGQTAVAASSGHNSANSSMHHRRPSPAPAAAPSLGPAPLAAAPQEMLGASDEPRAPLRPSDSMPATAPEDLSAFGGRHWPEAAAHQDRRAPLQPSETMPSEPPQSFSTAWAKMFGKGKSTEPADPRSAARF